MNEQDIKIKRSTEESPPRCDFCGREQSGDTVLLEGAGGVCICEDCVKDFARQLSTE